MIDGADLFEVYRDAMYRSSNDHEYAIGVVENRLEAELEELKEEIMEEFEDVMREEE